MLTVRLLLSSANHANPLHLRWYAPRPNGVIFMTEICSCRARERPGTYQWVIVTRLRSRMQYNYKSLWKLDLNPEMVSDLYYMSMYSWFHSVGQFLYSIKRYLNIFPVIINGSLRYGWCGCGSVGTRRRGGSKPGQRGEVQCMCSLETRPIKIRPGLYCMSGYPESGWFVIL